MILTTLGLLGELYLQSPEGDDLDSEVLIVTGSRFERPFDETSQTTQVHSIDNLDMRGILSLADGLSDARGVQVFQTGPAGSQASVFLRGTSSKHAIALLDGIQLNDPAGANGAFDFGAESLSGLSRIEIVTGPLSSVYGSYALGGAINMIPALGAETAIDPSLQLVAGSDETRQLRASAQGSTDRLDYGLSVEAFETGGFDSVPARMSTATGNRDGSSLSSLTFSGRFALTDSITWESLARIRSSDVEFDTFSGGPSESQRADASDLSSRNDYAVWRSGLAIETPALTARMRLGQVHSDLETRASGAVTDRLDGRRDFAELLLTGVAEPLSLDWSAGLQWQEDHADTMSQFGFPLKESESLFGGFGMVQIQPSERLTFSASARLDDYERFGSVETVQTGLVYALPELETRLRLSAGTGFKAPTLSERFASSMFIEPNPDLRPEESVSWEAGFDTDRSAVSFGAVYYETEITDLIETAFDFTTFTGQNVNIGRADISGYEAYLTHRPMQQVEWGLAYSYTDARNAVSGERLLRRSPHSWTGDVSYQITPAIAFRLDHSRRSSWRDVIYDDDGFFVSSNAITEGFGLWNASARWQIRRGLALGVSLFNLTDEVYEQPAAFAGGPRQVRFAITLGGGT